MNQPLFNGYYEGNRSLTEQNSYNNKLSPYEEKALQDLKDMFIHNNNHHESMWGIPFTMTTSSSETDVILLKFLRANYFSVSDSYDMLINAILWRQEYKTDSILEEDLGFKELEGVVCYMNGFDIQGHPVCYTDYSFLINNKQIHDQIFLVDENRKKFIRWKVQVIERGIKMLNFNPAAGGVDSIVLADDFKHEPTPEINAAEELIYSILLNNYPGIVSLKIATNVPFFETMLYSFVKLTRLFAKDGPTGDVVIANKTNTLYKYIKPEYIPIQFGGGQSTR